MVPHEEFALSLCPVGKPIVSHPGGLRLRAEVHDCLVDFGELNKAQAVLLKRMVAFVELSHEEGELVVVSFDLGRENGSCQCSDSNSDCLHHCNKLL